MPLESGAPILSPTPPSWQIPAPAGPQPGPFGLPPKTLSLKAGTEWTGWPFRAARVPVARPREAQFPGPRSLSSLADGAADGTRGDQSAHHTEVHFSPIPAPTAG